MIPGLLTKHGEERRKRAGKYEEMFIYSYTHTHKYLTLFGGLMNALILASPDERVILLRAGITGKQIENLFVELNQFKIVGAVLYDPDADKEA